MNSSTNGASYDANPEYVILSLAEELQRGSSMAKQTDAANREPAAPSNESNNFRKSSASSGLPGAFELFKPSTRVIMDNLAAFLLLLGIPLVLSLVGEFVHAMQSNVNGGLSFNGSFLTLGLIGIIADLLVAPGVILLQVNGVRRKTLSAGDAVTRGLHFFWRLLGLGIVMSFALLFALLLFIVPFFILLPRVIMAPYFLIDQDMGVFDSLRASNAAYKRYHRIWGILGVAVLLYLPSIIPVIGSIASTCLSFLYQPALAFRYEQFKRMDEDKDPKTPAESDLAA